MNVYNLEAEYEKCWEVDHELELPLNRTKNLTITHEFSYVGKFS